MKKYKLVKEYPGSPKLGVIWDEYSPDYAKYPEFWEEVVEYPIGTKVHNSQTNTIYTKKEDGWYMPAEKTTYTDEMISSKEHLTVLSKFEEVVDKKNPLKLEVGKEYILQYVYFKSKPQHIKITRFTSDGYPWQERVSDGGCKGIVLPGCYKLIEEVIKKDYEILTYRNFITGDINSIGQRFLSNEGYREFTERDLNAVNTSTGRKLYSIHSVKRLSDGEVFTVGDEANTKYSNYGNITEFELKHNKIYITTKSGKNRCYLDDLKSIKKFLFTTEDGVDIFEGDKIIYRVETGKYWNMLQPLSAKRLKINSDNLKLFSTKEAAEEYILLNKPCLSANDVIQYCIDNYNTVNDHRCYKLLKKLVKSKL